VGGGHYLMNTFTAADLQNWLMANGQDWRLRKAAIWTCYSASVPKSADPKNGGQDPSTILTFAKACGIRLHQQKSYMRKNCGLLFFDLLPQIGYGGNNSITTAQVAEELDQTWVCGVNQYPGGCDPTYSFRWVTQQLVNEYAELGSNGAGAGGHGFLKMPYSSHYDDETMMLDTTHVKDPSN
jgi:hypothetical protein